MLGAHPIHPCCWRPILPAARAFYHAQLGLEVLNESEAAIVGFAWGAWIVDPGKNALGMLQVKE